MGPMTGRAAGYCAGYAVPGFMNPDWGGFRGRGGGWGWRNWYRATGLTGWQRAGAGMSAFGGPWAYAGPYGYPPAPTRKQEREALEGQIEYLEKTLGDLRARIDELETEPDEADE
jgi:hypothetical protein